jgi:hypothetical protein
MGYRVLAITLMGFGAMLVCGSIGEIVLAAHPALLPSEALAIPFIAAHRDSTALRAWMIASNVINLGCAATFVACAPAVWRRRARAWPPLRHAATTLALVALAGIPVCLHYLLPLDAGPARAGSIVMLASVLGAAAGLATVCFVLVTVAVRAQRRAAAGF